MGKSRLLVVTAVLAVAGGAVVGAAGRESLIEAVDAFRLAWNEAQAPGGDVRTSTDFDTVFVLNAARNPVAGMAADVATGNGIFAVGNLSGVTNPTGIKVILGVSPANSGTVRVANGSNTTAFVIDGNTGLQSGPADLAEAFSATAADVAPGTVMVISSEQAGRLAISNRPYDRRVAGVVAGANEYPSAITLAGLVEKPNKVAVTLSGTVYTRVSSENGPVRAGDLLTTSSRSGVAMRATDPEASRGATIGKAMEDHQGEEGLLLILANLQ